MKILILLNIVLLIASLIWLKEESSMEPFIASIGTIITLITQICSSSKSKEKFYMSQKSGKKSTNYQSKGNINITNND